MATKVLVLTVDVELESRVRQVLHELGIRYPQAEFARTVFMAAWAVAESQDPVLLLVDEQLEGDETGSDFLDSPFARGRKSIGLTQKLVGQVTFLAAKEERDFLRLLREALSQALI